LTLSNFLTAQTPATAKPVVALPAHNILFQDIVVVTNAADETAHLFHAFLPTTNNSTTMGSSSNMDSNPSSYLDMLLLVVCVPTVFMCWQG